MIDQAARKQIADTIRSYLNDEIKAFQFADDLDEIAGQTADDTIHETVRALWYHYDDLKNHKIVASKEEWDYFHRLLLILESDAELETYSVRGWSHRQTVAACALAVFVIVALCLGWGPHLLVLSIPFGVVSMLLSYWHDRAMPRFDAMDTALWPFSSFLQLMAVRRQVRVFSKRRYPSHLTKRTIRPPAVNFLVNVQMVLGWGAMWLLFAPVPLLFQAMPEVDTRTRVRIPQQ